MFFVFVVLFLSVIFIFSNYSFASTNLLYTSLNSLLTAQTPEIGPAGTTNLDAGDFIPGHIGNGASFNADTDYLSYPVNTIFLEGTSIPKTRVIDFWYKPDYNQDDNTRDHFLLNSTANNFYLKHKNSDKSVFLLFQTKVLAPSFAYAGKNSISWQSGDWIHFQIYWTYTTVTIPDPATIVIPKMLVNGEEAESCGNGTYSNAPSPGANIFVGNKNNASSLSADGIIDELKIYDEVWEPNISSISPSNPDQGDVITITGTSFGPSENSTVTVGGTSATISSWTDTQIKAVIPDISSGTKSVIASTWGLVDSNSGNVTIGQAPAVTSLSASNISENSVTISWTTSKKSKTIIRWGTTESYGSEYSGSNYTKNHSKNLTNLDSSTRYHFKVFVEDKFGSTGSTGDYSFVTDTAGLIINPPSEDDSISYIDSSNSNKSTEYSSSDETQELFVSPTEEDRVLEIDSVILVSNESGQDQQLEFVDGTNYLVGNDFNFHGQITPNTSVCLVISDGNTDRVCTISDKDGYWNILSNKINPGNYKVWIEFPDSDKKSKSYDVMVKGYTATNHSGTQNNFKTIAILSSILLAFFIIIFFLKRKIKGKRSTL